MTATDKDTLRPLNRDYFRERAVIAEIRSLQAAGEIAQRRKFEESKRQGAYDISPEALVYFLREYYHRGDDRVAGDIMEALARRVIPSARKILFHSHGLTTDQKDQIIEALFAELYQAWLSLGPEDEFWEVRFSVCLKMKLIAVVKKNRRPFQAEHGITMTGSDGEEYDLTENIVDRRAPSAEQRALIADALGFLEEPIRTAFYLYHREEWTEERIASHMSVTDRTIRNYLRRAEQKLAEWRSME